MSRGGSKGIPLSDAQKGAIVEAYLSGIHIRHICRLQKRALLTVREVLDAAGLRGGVSIEECGL